MLSGSLEESKFIKRCCQDDCIPRNPHRATSHLSTIRPLLIITHHRFSDPTVDLEAQRHPFKVIESIGNHSGVGFALDVPGHPSVVAPEDIGAHILKRLLDMTADYLGYRQVRYKIRSLAGSPSS